LTTDAFDMFEKILFFFPFTGSALLLLLLQAL
jgi:hypothetical protein